MSNKASTNVVAKKLGLTPPTINRLVREDELFPRPIKIGRKNYYSLDEIPAWLQSRITCDGVIEPDDKIITGVRLLELTGRSKSWLWLNVIKPKTLTRINLSPDPETNKLVNFFIEREVYAAYGDLIEVAGEVA